ncbi:hypothetical protein ACYOEI_37820, partial [Singulisphaera rosea]
RALAATLCVADFLVSGAFLVSVGVALATWVRRYGRAITLSAVIYLVLGLVWPILVESAVSRWTTGNNYSTWTRYYRMAGHILVALSPMFGPNAALQVPLAFAWERREWLWIGMCVVLLIKATVAWFILWLTIRTFDRCMDRVPESRPSSSTALFEGKVDDVALASARS